MNRYHHVQKAPLYLLLIVIGAGMLVAGSLIPEPMVQLLLFITSAVMLFLAACFRQLTVSDEGHELRVAFGPLPLFQRRVDYANIKAVQPAATSFIEGWGIHLSPGGGWVWNLWGYDCVDISLHKGSRLRLGTNDQDQLLQFLQQIVEEDGSSASRPT